MLCRLYSTSFVLQVPKFPSKLSNLCQVPYCSVAMLEEVIEEEDPAMVQVQFVNFLTSTI